jgi:hypothetical protein
LCLDDFTARLTGNRRKRLGLATRHDRARLGLRQAICAGRTNDGHKNEDGGKNHSHGSNPSGSASGSQGVIKIT